ncbi:deoxyribodipyrimidine photo-lyase [Methyloglobulus sp.]|uniref:cryptochrome/photolyase family protein n=1 Tax=Methyloglobulus sp. TaxID=2518622 RepID=UPI0032B880F2
MVSCRYRTSLFIFRRDLRIQDNSALNQAINASDQVLPCFIFDPRQIKKHPYQSQPALQFMMQSLADLQQAFQTIGSGLALYNDLPADVIKQVFQQHSIQAVFVNRDYTPFSRTRDTELMQICQDLNIDFHSLPDCLLTEPEQALKSDCTPYKVFTAFYNNARQFPVPLPNALEKPRFIKPDGESNVSQSIFPQTETIANGPTGGRKQALGILGQLDKQADYQTQRDYPFLDATSHLSAHLKFGTCSVREVYYAIVQQLGSEHPLLRQLYWRDFFSHIAFHYPYVFGKAFHSQYDNLVWDNNRDYFQRWSEGNTGFPIVDAGMRELNETGFMHNRVRMIVASFLVKDLHISWRWGERYFAQHLVDYDPAVNNGNWQWAASTGCDAQPYFRIFNPWLQQQKFDLNCQYIYRWIPELNRFPAAVIHKWHSKHSGTTYPAPMVDHSHESQIAKSRYKNLLGENK